MITINFEKINKDATTPTFAFDGDAGADITAIDDYTIGPRETRVISTGLRFNIPDGLEMQVRPRSGLSSKGILTAFGTVDSKYRGEVRVTMYNSSDRAFLVAKGDRVAQLVIKPIYETHYTEGVVDTDTVRGEKGFGSTGVTNKDLFKGIFEGKVDPCNLDRIK